MRRSRHILSILAITAISILIYANTLKNGFVYDDEFTIVNNTFIKSYGNLPLLLDKAAYFKRSGEISYRPVVTFTYFLDYALYGLKPLGYHSTNILLHAANGALLYIFLTLLLTPHSPLFISPTFLIYLLFLTHPVLTEAVNSISYREDLLTFLFYIATLTLYTILKQRSIGKRPLSSLLLYFLSCLAYILALLSKEMAVTLPLIIFCYEWIYGREKTKLTSRLFNPYSMGYIAITLFYLHLRFYLFYNPEEQISAWGLVEIFLSLPWLIINYLKLSLIPVHLSADYVIRPVSSPFSLISIIAIVSIFAIILYYHPLAKRGDRRCENECSGQRSALFGALFFLITLTPVYNFVLLPNPFAERYLYLPVAGFIISAVYIAYISAEKLKVRPVYGNRYMSIFFLIVSIFSFSVVNRNTTWKDNYSAISG